MTAPRLKTPALFLLLLLLSALTRTAFCQEETSSQTKTSDSTTESQVSSATPPTIPGNNDITANTTKQPEDPEGSGSSEPDTSLEIVLMTDQSGNSDGETLDQSILIGAVVAGAIIGAIIIVGGVIWCRRSKNAGNQELTKEDPHLDGPSSEKVPMPMFEEDVPSVLELEMDELDQWMKKDS